jgi:hypothetical protein
MSEPRFLSAEAPSVPVEPVKPVPIPRGLEERAPDAAPLPVAHMRGPWLQRHRRLVIAGSVIAVLVVAVVLLRMRKLADEAARREAEARDKEIAQHAEQKLGEIDCTADLPVASFVAAPLIAITAGPKARAHVAIQRRLDDDLGVDRIADARTIAIVTSDQGYWIRGGGKFTTALSTRVTITFVDAATSSAIASLKFDAGEPPETTRDDIEEFSDRFMEQIAATLNKLPRR